MLIILGAIIGIIIGILPIFDWVASRLLYKAYKRSPGGIALKERAVVAIILAIITTWDAMIVGLVVFHIVLPPPLGLIVVSLSPILAGVPNLYWLSLYMRNRMRGKSNVS